MQTTLAGKKRPAKKTDSSRTYDGQSVKKLTPKRGRYTRYNGRRMYSMNKSLGLVVPDSAMVKFKACDTWLLTRVIASSTEPWMSFYSNNPYDPVVGASTTKCTGFDDLMSFYKRGIVYGFKIEVDPILITNVAEHVCYVHHMDHNKNNNTWLSLNQITETGLVDKWRLIYSYVFKIPGRDHMMSYKKIKDLERTKDLDIDNYSFTKSTGPTLTTLCNLGWRMADSSQNPDITTRAFVQITYYCKLFEKLTMTE